MAIKKTLVGKKMGFRNLFQFTKAFVTLYAFLVKQITLVVVVV